MLTEVESDNITETDAEDVDFLQRLMAAQHVLFSSGPSGPTNGELREDGTFELREDDGYELRE